jgi:hypothetical protein
MEILSGTIVRLGILVCVGTNLGVLAVEPDAGTIVPKVCFTAAPLKPSASWQDGPSVLLGHSAFWGGLEDCKTVYQPVREGGFRICGSPHRLNRHISQGQNRVWTGDVPLFVMDSYPWPAGVTIPIGRRCRRLWLLSQNYVHPSKCYVPNGEVVLHYAEGKPATTLLIPPYNLDCFYQHFSRQGVAVPLGKFDMEKVPNTATLCHADALEIAADPVRMLKAIELRATCSEGILGLAGLTILPDERTIP